MDNYQIAESFSLLAKLLDIHGENSFKTKSYASAAFAIENLTVQLSEIPREKIAVIKGIGSSCAQKIVEILETGHLKSLDEIIFSTPPGVTEMLNIKGIGAKKINTIWKEMEIETIGELLYACKENRLKLYKGFGEKTQQNITGSIEFYLKSKGRFLYSQVENFALATHELLGRIFGEKKTILTGAFKRQLEIINELEFVIEGTEIEIETTLSVIEGFELLEKNEGILFYRTSAGILLKINTGSKEKFVDILIRTSSSDSFYTEFTIQHPEVAKRTDITDEEGYFGNPRKLSRFIKISRFVPSSSPVTSGVSFTAIATGVMEASLWKKWLKPRQLRGWNTWLSAIIVNQHFMHRGYPNNGSGNNIFKSTN